MPGQFMVFLLMPALSQLHRVRLQRCTWHRQCSKFWTIWSSNARTKPLIRDVHQPVFRTISDQRRHVEMPTASVGKQTGLNFPHVTDKADDDVLSNLPASEREKLRAKIHHLHKNVDHASPTVMAEMKELTI